MSNDKFPEDTIANDQAPLSHGKREHGYHSPVKHANQKLEIFCVTDDARLIAFKLNSNTPTVVGEFSRFSHRLQVWVPIQCETCGAIQLLDLGGNYVDEVDSHAESIDTGRSRRYSNNFPCAGCGASISSSIRLSFYASSGLFSDEFVGGGKIVPILGIREFFTTVKTSSIPGYKSSAQGSLMHFG